jgi:hypothetical protein
MKTFLFLIFIYVSFGNNIISYDNIDDTMYLSVAINPEDNITVMTQLISSSLKKIRKTCGIITKCQYDMRIINKYIIDEIDEKPVSTNIYTMPSDFHITTYYKGNGGVYDRQNPVFQDFEENKEFDIIIRAAALIPNKIMTAVVYTRALSNNKHKHITLVLGDLQAVDSNEFLIQLFSKGAVLSQYFEEDFENSRNEVFNFQQFLFGSLQDVHFHVLEEDFHIKGYMKVK